MKNKLVTYSNTNLNFRSNNSDTPGSEFVSESINAANYTLTNIEESNVKKNETQCLDHKTLEDKLTLSDTGASFLAPAISYTVIIFFSIV